MRLLLTTLNKKNIYANLTLKYLYCIVSNSGLDVTLKEYSTGDDLDFIFTEIVRGGYDLVYFDCFSWNISRTGKLCCDLKNAEVGIDILLGGPETGVETEGFMRENPWVDFVIRGECEKPFSQFVGEYVRIENARRESGTVASEEGNYDFVDSLTYRKNGKIVSTPGGSLPPMENLPFPYTHLEVEQDKVICYESSRRRSVGGKQGPFKNMSFERVCRDVGYLMYKEVREVEFTDGNFNHNPARAANIWKYLIGKDNGVTDFTFRVSASNLDDEAFRILRKARKGMFRLKMRFKETSLPELERLASMDNVETCVSLTAGLPDENYGDFARSFDMLHGVEPTRLNIEFLKVTADKELKDVLRGYGYRYRQDAPHEVLATDSMSALDFVKLKMIKNVVDIFRNGKGFRKSLDFLMDELGFGAFNFYQRLADFYYGKGFHTMNRDMEKLYEAICGFAENFEEISTGIAGRTKDFLTMDMLETPVSGESGKIDNNR